MGEKTDWGEFILSFAPMHARTVGIKRVIRRNNVTIVFWDDGTKTVVKCSECGEECPIARANKLRRELKKPNAQIDRVDMTAMLLELIMKADMCSERADPEKAIMAAMLKRFYRGYQNDLRHALSIMEVQVDE